jgi:hypothetical protein
MSKALDLLAKDSPNGTPIGVCQICGEAGPLKESKRKRETIFYCIPCDIDGKVTP